MVNMYGLDGNGGKAGSLTSQCRITGIGHRVEMPIDRLG